MGGAREVVRLGRLFGVDAWACRLEMFWASRPSYRKSGGRPSEPPHPHCPPPKTPHLPVLMVCCEGSEGSSCPAAVTLPGETSGLEDDLGGCGR